ncbi:M15 family metallopeptidase [Flavobacterium sp.]|uniref:M15 family metallopeptidase n=1 Tax=Flavobacterium sp. TaxID=239 RepID=UPI0037526F1F
MKKLLILFLFFQYGFCQSIPQNVKKLIKFYPQIINFKENKLFFKDGSTLIYDDKIKKSTQEIIDNPDIEDQFFYIYKLGNINDAGRIRNEAFFKKIYGNSKVEVEKSLVEIVWCPKLVNQKIMITNVNGVDKIVKKLSAELDNHPEFKNYLSNIAGTFNWRKIAGTSRLSMHSFGMTIDINTKFSNYWQWDCKCKNENVKLTYKNKIPQKLVSIFEKYGFIWGGNWYHYDTMHFEYRPEMLD